MEVDTTESAFEDAIRVLERFVVENDDLAELEALIGRFNIFDALGVVRQEIRHSNFLAWLLDPSESHGLGQLFLRSVLMDLLRNASHEQRPMSPVELDGSDLGGVEVRREWRNIDLLIIADDPKIVVAIENKIDSGEHSDQLTRYRETIERGFPEHRPMYVFLTREGDEPSEEAWVSYSYADLFRALDRCRRINAESIGGDVEAFLDHYLRLIGSRFMDDPKIDELCDRIYRNHRQALELIFERKGDARAGLIRYLVEQLDSDRMQWSMHATKYGCGVWPAAWDSLIPPVCTYGKRSPHGLVRMSVSAYPRQIWVEFFISPSSDSEIRQQLLDAVLERGADFGLRVRSKSPGPEWTTIYSKSWLKRKDGLSDDEDARSALDKLASELSERAERMTPLLEQVFA